MYLGMMIERAASKELFEYPLHPYTKALLAAVPEPDIHHQRQKLLLQGELSSPINPLPGCRFAPRCPHAKEICSQVQPEWKEVRPGHCVACHCVREINGL
jgi:peptide/nickel transport system ATP-binding protein